MDKTKKQLEKILRRETEELELLQADVKVKTCVVNKLKELIDKE